LARLGPDKLIIHYLSLIHLGHIPGSVPLRVFSPPFPVMPSEPMGKQMGSKRQKRFRNDELIIVSEFG
jgi:hypothetical protein